jgi:signal transduction histidine kinase
MSKLINELLLLSKIDSVGKSKDIEQINVSEELELISSAFESMAYEKNIKYETDIKEDILFNIDKEDLKHISSTLIDNAIKHTNGNNCVKINLSKEKDGFKLEVKNQGEEIPKSERERIFERFYRVDKARNREEKRYGLGLSICKATVEKYKGTIDIDYKDGYTIFKVKI